jgi:hypothetical protein
MLFKAGLSINGVQNGYDVIATNENNAVYDWLIDDNIINKDGFFAVLETEDFIDKGQELLMKIEQLI